jgi:hypothetical protein
MSAVNGVACPACGSKHTEKLLSSFQRVRVGKADLPATVTSGARAGGCCGGGCGCG